jgi:hypothetical protein
MRDIVDAYWESLSDEERAKWTAEAATHGLRPPTPGIASAVTAPQYLVPMNIGPDASNDAGGIFTIFLDGLIKRPATGTLTIRCYWCDENRHLLNEDLQDGWHLVEDAAKPDRPAHYMCPDCAKTEIPE